MATSPRRGAGQASRRHRVGPGCILLAGWQRGWQPRLATGFAPFPNEATVTNRRAACQAAPLAPAPVAIVVPVAAMLPASFLPCSAAARRSGPITGSPGITAAPVSPPAGDPHV